MCESFTERAAEQFLVELGELTADSDPSVSENVLGVGEHVHEMADRRALVAADIADAAFQQRLGDGENPLAGKLFAGAEPQLLDFLDKGPFRHFRVLLLAGPLAAGPG